MITRKFRGALDGFHAADVVVGVDRRIRGSLVEGRYGELKFWEPAKSRGMGISTCCGKDPPAGVRVFFFYGFGYQIING